MNDDFSCPCGSRRHFSSCCALFLKGERIAPTAEALMRSRYTAFVLKDEVYLLHTWHRATRPTVLNLDKDMGLVWKGLHVRRTEAGQSQDQRGVVAFVARYEVDGKMETLHETSRFVREDGRWVYLDGEIQAAGQSNESLPGRNAPCPCGSGKKYKRCCGKRF